MNAPAVVLLAEGSPVVSASQVDHSLRKRLQTRRPHLDVQLAFARHGSPSAAQVVSALAHRGTDEIVLVSLSLNNAIQADDSGTAVVDYLNAHHPELRVELARPIGPAPVLLNIVDDRLRAALRQSRATELDALVLAMSGHGDDQGNALAVRRARQWSAHHRLPCTLAFMDGSGTTAAQAVADLRSAGRRHIGVGVLAIGDDASHLAQREAALDQGAVAVGAPLGADDRLLDLVIERYAYAAMALLDAEVGVASLFRAAGN